MESYSCGDDTCYYTVYKIFTCMQVLAHYTSTNGTVMNAELFKSHKQARETDFDCSVLECRSPKKVHEFVKDLRRKESFGMECHYHPEEPQYVYIDTYEATSLCFDLLGVMRSFFARFAQFFGSGQTTPLGLTICIINVFRSRQVCEKYMSLCAQSECRAWPSTQSK